MRTFFIALLFCLFDLAAFPQGMSLSVAPIPSGGSVVALDSTLLLSTVFVDTRNAAVNLGSNSYGIQFTGMAPLGTNMICRFDATLLTAVAANVSIFGLTPLKDYPNQGVYYIRYLVRGTNNSNKNVYVTYVSSMVQPSNVNNRTTYNASLYLNDSLKTYGPVQFQFGSPIQTGSVLAATGDSGQLGYSNCTPAYFCGNTGLSLSNYLGMNDTVGLNWRMNNLPFGRFDYTLSNISLGYESMLSNTSGTLNSAYGYEALFSNTIGANNTGIGVNALSGNTTGIKNVGVGQFAFGANATGNFNTAIGYHANAASSSTGSAVAIGYNSIADNASVSIGALSSAGVSGIALGQGMAASAGQFTVGGENEWHPNFNNCLNCVPTDTSGLGNFTPRPLPGAGETYFTPITGDSIQPQTQDAFLNPAGTLANLTIIMPPLSSGITKIALSFSQVITNLHYSIRLESGSTVSANAPTGIPTITGGLGVVHLKYNSNTSSWQPY